ncbi:MAG: hypothetical protein IPM16_23975 [Chloroflexi bacterium]|nr:hypothetical protein [Chloroflexota bacterium]
MIAAKYDPVAGWLDSNALIYRYARVRPPPRSCLACKDTQIRVENGRVRGVSDAPGDIASPHVVIASEPAPVPAEARGIRTTGHAPPPEFPPGWRHDPFPEDAPMIIGAAPYPHVHVEAKTSTIFGWEYQWRTKSARRRIRRERRATRSSIGHARRAVEGSALSVADAAATRASSATRTVRILPTRATCAASSHNIGYYVYRDASVAYRTLPDGRTQPYDGERAIIDSAPSIDGLTVSIAHAGHGIMTSPAAGKSRPAKSSGLPLADPSFSHFGWDVPWVEHGGNALTGARMWAAGQFAAPDLPQPVREHPRHRRRDSAQRGTVARQATGAATHLAVRRGPPCRVALNLRAWLVLE